MKPRFPVVFILFHAALLALAGLQMQHCWPQLPARLVIHFGDGGKGLTPPQITKQAFLCLYMFLLALLPGLMLGGTFLLRVLPLRLIRLPNKHYWLAPERRQKTHRRLERDMGIFVLFLCLLVIALLQLVLQANLVTPPLLDTPLFFALLGVFLAATPGFILTQLRRLRLPAGAQDNKSKP
jgi:hypothetical protein